MKPRAAIVVLLIACASLGASGGVSAAAARSCAASLGTLEHTMSTHADVHDARIARAARRSFTHCGSAAFWTVPAKHDDVRRLISTRASLDEDLWVICRRYDHDFVTPVCEDRHENG